MKSVVTNYDFNLKVLIVVDDYGFNFLKNN